MFDPKPFYFGHYDIEFLRKTYSGYYLKEITHRPYALGDLALTVGESQIEAMPHPVFWHEVGEVTIYQYMAHRIRVFYEEPYQKLRSSKHRFIKVRTLEGIYKSEGYKDYKRRAERAARSKKSLHDHMTMSQVIAHCQKMGYDAPKFSEKCSWLNCPNPDYVPPPVKQELVQVPDPPKKGPAPFNKKLLNEKLLLQRVTAVGYFPKKRHLLRRFRLLEDHLYNIVNSSELYSVNKTRENKDNVFKLIKAVPFIGYFDSKVRSGSIRALPPWARRVVSKNLFD